MMSAEIAPLKAGRFSDLGRIAFIMLIALAARAWIISRSEVISRDGVGFIRYARQLEDPPVSPKNPDRLMTRTEVLRASFHPPGYAYSILMASYAVRACCTGNEPDIWVRSAQLASLMASLLLVIPTYFVGKAVFDRQTAFVATLIFQALPVSAQVASDGLSDNLFLLAVMNAVWAFVVGLQRASIARIGLGGFLAGLAYLVRPEGLILLPAIAGVLMFARTRREINWRAFLRSGALVTAGALAVIVPYAATIGRITNKPTGGQLFNWLGGEEMKPTWVSQTPLPRQDVNLLLADWWNDFGNGEQPTMLWAGSAFGRELLKTSFYVMPFLALVGAWATRSQLRAGGGMQLLVLLGTLHSLLLLRLAKGAGYVAERHTLLIVLCSSYFAAAALPYISDRVARIGYGSGRRWSIVAAVMLVASCLPASMKPLHASRAGHRGAGLWIAAQNEPDAYLIDPFSWGEFFAGHTRLPATMRFDEKTVYVIVEANSRLHPRLHMMPFAKHFAAIGKPVYQWPANVPAENARVFVYRWQGDDFNYQWALAYIESRRAREQGARE